MGKPALRAVPAKRPPPVKSSGFAVGVSKVHYDWITATAAAVGVSRQKLLDGIVGRLVARASLNTPRTRRARGAR
jgi:hypothetical protein